MDTPEGHGTAHFGHFYDLRERPHGERPKPELDMFSGGEKIPSEWKVGANCGLSKGKFQ